MAEYDGSIRIGTGIDEKGFKAGSKELEAEVRRMAKTVSKSLGDGAKTALQKQTDAFVKANQQYAQQEQKIKDLGVKLHELQRTKVETPIFKETTKELSSAEKKLDEFYGKLREIEKGRGFIPDLTIKKEKAELKDMEKELFRLISVRDHLSSQDSGLGAARQAVKDYEKQVDALKEKLQQQINTNEKIKNSVPYKNANAQIEIYEKKVRELRGNLESLKKTGEAYQQADTGRVLQQIADAEQKQMQMYSALQTSADSLTQKTSQQVVEEARLSQIRENAVVGNQRIIEVVERRKELLQEIADLEKAGVGAGYQQYDAAKEELAGLNQEITKYNNRTAEVRDSYKRLGDAVKKFGSVMKDVFSSLDNFMKKADAGLKRIAKAIGGFFSSTKKSADNNASLIKAGFKNILKYGLGIRSLYVLVNKIRAGIKEGFSNFMGYSSRFKNSIDSLKSSALTLKNAFASAFAPLVEIAVPYIQRVIDYVTQLIDTVGQLMAAVTGQKTYTKAIKQTTAAIEDQNSAQNKQLSNLDHLNNLTSGSGGSGGRIFKQPAV